MTLEQLSVTNVRCIEQAQLQTAPGLTVLWGDNGSGKTSLLEAIFMLGRGRSFRSRNNDRLIRHDQDHLRIIGGVRREPGDPETLSFEVTRESTVARIGTRPAASFAELSQEFPVQVIDPGIHRLIEEGGYRRRRWLDWAVFHVEPSFVSTWLRYMRTLKQRNAALRSMPGEAAVWDPELARLGESITHSRQRLVEELQPYWRETVEALTGFRIELQYLQGWNREHSLIEALTASHARDAMQHVTHSGPHRADIAVRLDGRHAREVLSRGQQKLAAAAMTVAQLKLLRALTELRPTLLLDDPAAELDGERLERFIAQVASLECQLIVTSLRPESRLFGTPGRAFRVERGRVHPV